LRALRSGAINVQASRLSVSKRFEGRLFFAGTADAAQRWKSLCLRLEAAGTDMKWRDEMIFWSDATFELFEALLLSEPDYG
jgi:hypothetical protein